MRLIDKDELRKKALIVDDFREADLGFYIIPAPVFDNAPIVDAVEVVRCKDCLHRFDDGTCLMVYDATHCHAAGIILVKDTDYCSYGERRSDT